MPSSNFWRAHLLYTLPVLLWMSFMFFMSGGTGSADNTNPVVNSLLRKFFPWLANQLTPEMVDRVDFNIRKTAHVTEYTILSILLFRALTRGKGTFRNGYVLGTLLLGIGWAASDEYHQSFIPSRWAAAADVFFDSTGVLLGLVLCLWRWLWRTQNTVKQTD
ncbi:MAG: VanZ family protein [Armatimonas sp.]